MVRKPSKMPNSKNVVNLIKQQSGAMEQGSDLVPLLSRSGHLATSSESRLSDLRPRGLRQRS